MSATDAAAGLVTLERVSAFLAAEVVPAVPAELAGEVRAAIKLLRTVAIELDTRQDLLRAEIDELLALGAAAVGPTGPLAGECAELLRSARQGAGSLSELDRLHARVQALTSRVVLALQDDSHQPSGAAALAGLYDALGRHARARLSWQAVFPVPTTETPKEGTPA